MQEMSYRERKQWALLVLRIGLAVILIPAGYEKLFGGMAAFTGAVAQLGFPAPAFFAYAAALSEFLGGIAILLGILTEYAAVFIGIVMLVALIGVDKFVFPASDSAFAVLAMAIAVGLMGPGRFSLRHKFMAKKMMAEKPCCGSGACACQSGMDKPVA